MSVYGDTFVTGASVTFCGDAARNVTVVNATKITYRTPAHAAGVCDVTVRNPDGQQGTLPAGFTFQ